MWRQLADNYLADQNQRARTTLRQRGALTSLSKTTAVVVLQLTGVSNSVGCKTTERLSLHSMRD